MEEKVMSPLSIALPQKNLTTFQADLKDHYIAISNLPEGKGKLSALTVFIQLINSQSPHPNKAVNPEELVLLLKGACKQVNEMLKKEEERRACIKNIHQSVLDMSR